MSEPLNLRPDLVLGLEAGHIPAHLLPLPWANSALGNLAAPPSRVARFSNKNIGFPVKHEFQINKLEHTDTKNYLSGIQI